MSADAANTRTVDMKFEIVVVPVSDVDLAKRFYGSLGWRLDADFDGGEDFRAIQFTPPSSGCSVIFGKNVTAAAPGSAQGLYLIVSDIAAARADFVSRGVEVSEVFHGAGGVYAGPDQPYLFGRRRVAGRTQSVPATAPLPRSAIRTAMGGSFRRLPLGCRAAWKGERPSLQRPSSRPRCAAPRRRMASIRSASVCVMRAGQRGTPNTWFASKPARSYRFE